MMGRLIMEMLGQDLKVLSMKKVSPGMLNIEIEDNTGQHSININVDYQEFVKLFCTLMKCDAVTK
jgi:hypothetical protein